jgi:hypothetical protein
MNDTWRDFVSSDGFQQACSHRSNRHFDPASVRDGDVVYHRYHWREYFRHTHPRIQAPYVLVSNFHDRNIDQAFPGVEDETLVHFYANNVSVDHPKITCIPHGIKQGSLKAIPAELPQRRDILCYLNCTPNHADRRWLYEHLSAADWCVVRPCDKLQQTSYWLDLFASRFVLCPRGNGEDTYRIWDSLFAGAIPVVKTSFLDYLFADLPVLVVQDWSDVTPQLLESCGIDYDGDWTKYPQLKNSWWFRRLNIAKRESQHKTWRDIKGHYSFHHVYVEQVKRAQDGDVFVELGAWMGTSACAMGELIRDSGKRITFYTVDHGLGSPELARTVKRIVQNGSTLWDELHLNIADCGLTKYVRPLRMDSALAAGRFADKSVSFVFIDANHSEESVSRDIAAWLPKVKPGGVLAGHDWPWKSVQAGVRQHIAEPVIDGSSWIQLVG